VWNGGHFKLFLTRGLSNIVRRENSQILGILLLGFILLLLNINF
jgi:hypothetical protein